MKTLISTYHITEYDFFHDLISKDGQLIAFWGLPGRYGIPSFPSRVSRQDAVGNPERLEMALGKVLQRTRGQLLPVLPDCPQVHGFLQKKQRRIAWFSLKRLLLGICVCVCGNYPSMPIDVPINVFGGGATDAALVKALDV